MDKGTLLEWFKFGWVLFAPLMVLLYNIFIQRIKSVEADCSAVEDDQKELSEKHAKSIGGIKDRLAMVDARLEHTPSKDDVNALNLKVTELCGEINVVNTGLENLSRGMARVEQYLIDEAKK